MSGQGCILPSDEDVCSPAPAILPIPTRPRAPGDVQDDASHAHEAWAQAQF